MEMKNGFCFLLFVVLATLSVERVHGSPYYGALTDKHGTKNLKGLIRHCQAEDRGGKHRHGGWNMYHYFKHHHSSWKYGKKNLQKLLEKSVKQLVDSFGQGKLLDSFGPLFTDDLLFLSPSVKPESGKKGLASRLDVLKKQCVRTFKKPVSQFGGLGAGASLAYSVQPTTYLDAKGKVVYTSTVLTIHELVKGQLKQKVIAIVPGAIDNRHRYRCGCPDDKKKRYDYFCKYHKGFYYQ